MKLEKYIDAKHRLPVEGKHIIGYQSQESIVVYQAYKESIAAYATGHQALGGADFNYDRMSWIKPGFLWMMYRSGWASKENQERILAIEISKKDFAFIMQQAVHSSYKPGIYQSNADWNTQLKSSDVVMQWDPDHDQFGRKIERRAVQLGLRGAVLEHFGKQFIKRIDDITDFVKEQHSILKHYGEERLMIPYETVFQIEDENT